MEPLLNFESYPVACVKTDLLRDMTTGKNIIWGTNSYAHLGEAFQFASQIKEGTLTIMPRGTIMPRVEKSLEQQSVRTKALAEVFTPSWIVNEMNNYCDEDWFGRKDVFNKPNDDHTWTISDGKIEFPEGKTWKDYIASRRMEITCGEAPFIVSRYDTTTGNLIPLYNRIGMLDRKLRVVAENTNDEREWNKWVVKAYKSVYGYEYQGDNLLIARINMLYTYVDYYQKKWNKKPSKKQLKKIADIVCWNIWQMDGLKGTVPGGRLADVAIQPSMDDYFEEKELVNPYNDIPSMIYDWENKQIVKYIDCREG